MIFGPTLEGQSQDSDVAPFYISLRVHYYVLHNAMFDSRVSHNLMPKAIMEKLGLDITRKYHDLYSFDSGRVSSCKILGANVRPLAKLRGFKFLVGEYFIS